MDQQTQLIKFYNGRLVFVVFLLLVLLLGGMLGYNRLEGWRYLDALYFSAYTLTTVGYGDFVPKTDMGKIFTIGYVFFGVGTALYGLSILGAYFVERREKEFYGRWSERTEGILRNTQMVLGKLGFYGQRDNKLREVEKNDIGRKIHLESNKGKGNRKDKK